MRAAIVAIVLSVNLFALDASQLALAKRIYSKAKQFNLGYTMAAIAWQESQLGKYNLNLADPSCGVFHVMPRYMAKGKWKQSRVCERLIEDFDFSFSVALERFKYFENYWKSRGVSRVWSHAVGSYNGGFKPNYKYTEEIRKKIRILRKLI